MDWLLFLPQLPASPSTLRVMVWRRMRTAGALGLQNGVWVLPRTSERETFAEELLTYIHAQGASGYIFKVGALNEAIQDDILARFRAECDEEYDEFVKRCEALLAELDRETGQEKFTFAELEETEEDLKKLENWWNKIGARDFVGGKRRQAALEIFERCQTAHRLFASRVYESQGLQDSADD